MKDLECLVAKFRNAIEIAKGKGALHEFPLIRYFPRECCDMESDLLSQSLLENNIRTYSVHGTLWGDSPDEIQPHTWLMTDENTIIDITGDQFRSYPAPLNYNKRIYVGKTDCFHNQFDVKDNDICENIGFSAYMNNDEWSGVMSSVYGIILNYI